MGFGDDETTPGRGRAGTVDSTSSDDRRAEGRWREIDETKKSCTGVKKKKEEEIKHLIETERKMKVQEGKEERDGGEQSVHCWYSAELMCPVKIQSFRLGR